MIRWLNIWLAGAVLLTALLLNGSLARAQDAKRVTVLKFTGPSAGAVHAQVTQALRQRSEVELVGPREVTNTAGRLGNSLESASDFREVGEALELSAFIEGKVVKRGRNLQATVSVRNAASGEVVHEETWTRRRSKVKTIKALVWNALEPAISETSAPTPKAKPKPKPKPEEEEPDEIEEEEEEEEAPKPRPRREPRDEERPPSAELEKPKPARPGDKSVMHPALVLSAGPRLMWRKLKYDDYTNLNSYRNEGASPAFVLGVGLQYYPGAHVSNAWSSNLGIDADFDYALGLKSNLRGQEYKTRAYEYAAGAIYRIPFESFEPRIRVGYLRQVFEVDVPAAIDLPRVEYSALRIGIGTAIHVVEWLSFDASYAYLLMFGNGQLDEQRFGDSVDSRGWEAGAGGMLRFKEVYGARVAVDYRRYKYDFGTSFNPDVMLPTGGTDGYLRLSLSFVYSLPGVR